MRAMQPDDYMLDRFRAVEYALDIGAEMRRPMQTL
jgi:hypothetical protein